MEATQIKLKIDDAIWKRYPHLKVGVLIAKNIDNSRQDGEILKLLRKSEHDAKNKYAQIDLGNVGKLTDWREAYRSFGYKPSSTRCSTENSSCPSKSAPCHRYRSHFRLFLK